MDARRATRQVRGLVSVGTVGTVAAALLAGGCTSYTKKTLYEGGPRTLGPDQPDVGAADSNAARLGSLPGTVQSSFNRDFAGATVTQVRMEPTGTGSMFYRIVFIQDGRPSQVVYRSDGRDLADNGETVIVRDDDNFVPIAKPDSRTTPPPTRDIQ
jgi:hypothetical protein